MSMMATLFLSSHCSIDENDILKAVKNVKYTFLSPSDDIPAILVVDCIKCLVLPLCNIFNIIFKKFILRMHEKRRAHLKMAIKPLIITISLLHLCPI